jgi:proteic killer suppression protein
LDIRFGSAREHAFFCDDRALKKKYGPQMARKIRQRLDDLSAADTLSVMRSLPGRCHELTADLAGTLSVDLVQPQRLLFRPTEPVPRLPDGGLDWTKVTSIEIVGIEDTHE